MIQRYNQSTNGDYPGMESDEHGDYVLHADQAAAMVAKDAEIAEIEARKDAAYLERNQCVALIATMAHALGHWAGTARTAIEGWSEDWHGCVYVDLPAGQVSWHYHDSQAYLFAHLPPYCGEWDGHDTPEKYRRVLQRPVSNARAERAEQEAAGLRAAGRALLACPHIAERDTDPDWVDAETEAAVAEMRDALKEGE